jgi:hypothetical protein
MWWLKKMWLEEKWSIETTAQGDIAAQGNSKVSK